MGVHTFGGTMKRFILSAFIAKVSANCNAGWLFDGVDKCHKVLPNKATWDGAKTACTDAGASLAVPTHYGVSDGVFRVQSSDRVWLGIEKSGDRWVDTSGNPVAFTQWYGNQPDNYMGRGEFVRKLRGNEQRRRLLPRTLRIWMERRKLLYHAQPFVRE